MFRRREHEGNFHWWCWTVRIYAEVQVEMEVFTGRQSSDKYSSRLTLD